MPLRPPLLNPAHNCFNRNLLSFRSLRRHLTQPWHFANTLPRRLPLATVVAQPLDQTVAHQRAAAYRRPARPPDGYGTRAYRSDLHSDYDAALVLRCLPDTFATAPPYTATIVTDATNPVVRSGRGGRISGHLCSGSTICLLEHASATTRHAVGVGTSTASSAATTAGCESCPSGPSHPRILVFGLDCIYIGLVEPLACSSLVHCPRGR